MTTLNLSPNSDKKPGTAGADSINGLAGNDTITGLAGNDTLNGGIGNDSLDGGTDNDVLLGETGNDILLGGAGNDSLNGGEGSDKLDGGAGADTLDGGTGTDNMIGGDGNDLYFIDNIGDKITETAKSTGGTDSVKSSVNYTLPASVENLELMGLANLNATGNALANKLTGNASDNRLDGGNGFDTLMGGEGDDTLLGGIGVDQLTGGNGSDTYQVSSTEDIISETASDGDQDVVESSVSYTLGKNLEILTLTGLSRIDGTGNSLANTLEGNDSDNNLSGEEGDDTLQGNGGDDTLQGGAGDDEIDGGDGDDQVVYLGNRDDYKIDFDADSQTWSIEDINSTDGDGVDEGTDRLTAVETLQFADGAYQPGQPSLSVADISLNEGNSGTSTARFILSLSEPASQPVTVAYVTQDNTALAGSDYLTENSSVTFAPGEREKVVAVRVLGDTQLEDNETFFLQLTDVIGADLDNGLAMATLVNDDRPSLRITDTRVSESARTATISVTLQAAATTPVSVQYATLDGTATAGKDYTAARGSLTFAPSETSKTITVPLLGDSLSEADESFRVLLTSPTGATLDAAHASAIVTLTDDDGLNLTLSSDKTRLKAGDTATLRFSFSDIPTGFSATDITLSGGTLSDFQADASGKVYTALFTPSLQSNSYQASVNVNAGSYTDSQNRPGSSGNSLTFTGDTQAPSLTITSDKTSLKAGDTATVRFSFSELPQGFTLNDIETTSGTLSNLQADNSGLVYTANFISTTNAAISIAADSYTDAVGNLGLTTIPLNLSLDTGLPATVSNNDNDSTTRPVTSTALPSVIDLGSQYGKLIQPVQVDGSHWFYYWDISGDGSLADKRGAGYTNNMDYAPKEWLDSLFTQDVNGREGTGIVDNTYRYTTLNGYKLALPTVGTGKTLLTPEDYNHYNGTAVGGNPALSGSTVNNPAYDDYLAVWDAHNGTGNGMMDYGAPPGWSDRDYWSATPAVSGNAHVYLHAGYLSDNYDYILLNVAVEVLSGPVAGALPTLSIADKTLKEGNGGVTFASMTVKLSMASNQPVTVNYATQDGTAQAGSDYMATQDTISFGPGETRKTIQIPIMGDNLLEKDETFQMQLKAAVNAQLNPNASTSTITISNDDTPPPGSYYAGQSVIDLGGGYGKLIRPVNVDGNHWFYYWDISGDAIVNTADRTTHDWLDNLFNQDANGRTGRFDTDNTYRYTTLNGVKLALPTVGDGQTVMTSMNYYPNGTMVGGYPAYSGSAANNPTYDDFLAIWDAYNGTATNNHVYGTPPGWENVDTYWTGTPSNSGHAVALFRDAYSYDTFDYYNHYVAVEVL